MEPRLYARLTPIHTSATS